MSDLARLNDQDKKFEEDVKKRRERIEKIVLTLSFVFLIHTIISFIILRANWVNSYLHNLKVNTFVFYSVMYLENVVFGIFMVFLFNKYKF